MPEVIPTPKIPGDTPVSHRFDRQVDRISTPPAGGGGTLQHPFQILNTTPSGDDPTPTINVRYGTLQDIEPDNVAADQTLESGDSEYFVYLHVTIDLDGNVTAAELVIDTSAQPADGDNDGYITLGTVEVTDGAIATINQAATHSLRTAMCGRVVTDDELTTAGTWEFWGF